MLSGRSADVGAKPVELFRSNFNIATALDPHNEKPPFGLYFSTGCFVWLTVLLAIIVNLYSGICDLGISASQSAGKDSGIRGSTENHAYPGEHRTGQGDQRCELSNIESMSGQTLRLIVGQVSHPISPISKVSRLSAENPVLT